MHGNSTPLVKPLGLTDSEYDAVLAACRPLQPHQRSEFLADLANELRSYGTREYGEGRIFRAIRIVQRRHWDPPNFDVAGRPAKYD
jgi:hypothetical protein